jgi:cyclopropane fatty-acyl-phospholipid synthase-like methyltransferase
MRTANDFDALYRSLDPWSVTRAAQRDKPLFKTVAQHVTDKNVLELGCGEGHLTAAVFNSARHVKGVDISSVAISRALSLCLANATFATTDFMDMSLEGYDTISALECMYYLSREEQEAFFHKLTREHPSKPFILSGPIIGQDYFTIRGLES